MLAAPAQILLRAPHTWARVDRMETIAMRGSDGFGLGRVEATSRVVGGLSNDMWHVRTAEGEFAVKVMRAHAETAGFRGNVEAAFQIEMNAFRSGVPCPEPKATPEGHALLRVDGHWLRAHRWHEGTVPDPAENLSAAGALLARIHRAGHVVKRPLEDELMGIRRWTALARLTGLPGLVSDQLRRAAPDLARLESKTLTSRGLLTGFVASHGDLDPKNTLLADGRLLAVDWDAAGPRSFAREAVSLSLDWSDDITGFRRTLAAYAESSGETIPDEPWVFGGWVEALSGWLVYNAEQRAHTHLGLREVSATCSRLVALHQALDEYMSAVEMN